MTPSDAIRRKAIKLQVRLQNIERQTIKDAGAAADKQSSGSYSQPGLDKAGNPFSRAHPDSSFDPALIHQGVSPGGKPRLFRVSWRHSGPVLSGDRIESKVWNVDPNAAFLLKSPRMVPRNVKEAILAQVLPIRAQRLRRAISGARNA